jgi:hypothetical protein
LSNRGLKKLVAPLILAVLPFVVTTYRLQEGFVVLVTIALASLLISIVLAVFVLLQDGLGRLLRSAKGHWARLDWSPLHLWTDRKPGGDV